MSKRVQHRRRKSNREPYFTQETENAIILYNTSDSNREKERVFTEKIYPALSKLAEFSVNMSDWEYYLEDKTVDDAISEIVTYQLERIHKYKKENGKAFSYFTVMTRNFLIAENKYAYKKKKQRGEVELIDTTRDLDVEESIKSSQEDLSVFFDEFINKMNSELIYIFKNMRDLDIANSLLHILSNRNMIEDFNKKTIYKFIKEMTNCKDGSITPVVKIIKKQYIYYKRFYDKHNHLDMSGSYF